MHLEDEVRDNHQGLGMKEIYELGAKAAKLSTWRWMPGMLCDRGRVLKVYAINGKTFAIGFGQEGIEDIDCESATPDLTDPATLGAMLLMVLEAYEGWDVHVWRDNAWRWRVVNSRLETIAEKHFSPSCIWAEHANAYFDALQCASSRTTL